jgi:hypothetical protein
MRSLAGWRGGVESTFRSYPRGRLDTGRRIREGDFTFRDEANMGTEEIVRSVMIFFTGGMAVAIYNSMKEARQKAVANLQEQLRLLYGPLHCLTTQNMEILKFAVKLQESINSNSKVAPHEQEIPPARGAVAHKIIELSNTYSAKFKENNARIMQLLEANWSLIDMEDVAPFLAFLADYARMQVEVDEKHGEDVADRVNQHLGDIYYVRPEFVERVKAQWNAKRERLGELLMPHWWPWSKWRGGRKAA